MAGDAAGPNYDGSHIRQENEARMRQKHADDQRRMEERFKDPAFQQKHAADIQAAQSGDKEAEQRVMQAARIGSHSSNEPQSKKGPANLDVKYATTPAVETAEQRKERERKAALPETHRILAERSEKLDELANASGNADAEATAADANRNVRLLNDAVALANFYRLHVEDGRGLVAIDELTFDLIQLAAHVLMPHLNDSGTLDTVDTISEEFEASVEGVPLNRNRVEEIKAVLERVTDAPEKSWSPSQRAAHAVLHHAFTVSVTGEPEVNAADGTQPLSAVNSDDSYVFKAVFPEGRPVDSGRRQELCDRFGTFCLEPHKLLECNGGKFKLAEAEAKEDVVIEISNENNGCLSYCIAIQILLEIDRIKDDSDALNTLTERFKEAGLFDAIEASRGGIPGAQTLRWISGNAIDTAEKLRDFAEKEYDTYLSKMNIAIRGCNSTLSETLGSDILNDRRETLFEQVMLGVAEGNDLGNLPFINDKWQAIVEDNASPELRREAMQQWWNSSEPDEGFNKYKESLKKKGLQSPTDLDPLFQKLSICTTVQDTSSDNPTIIGISEGDAQHQLRVQYDRNASHYSLLLTAEEAQRLQRYNKSTIAIRVESSEFETEFADIDIINYYSDSEFEAFLREQNYALSEVQTDETHQITTAKLTQGEGKDAISLDVSVQKKDDGFVFTVQGDVSLESRRKVLVMQARRLYGAKADADGVLPAIDVVVDEELKTEADREALKDLLFDAGFKGVTFVNADGKPLYHTNEDGTQGNKLEYENKKQAARVKSQRQKEFKKEEADVSELEAQDKAAPSLRDDANTSVQAMQALPDLVKMVNEQAGALPAAGVALTEIVKAGQVVRNPDIGKVAALAPLIAMPIDWITGAGVGASLGGGTVPAIVTRTFKHYSGINPINSANLLSMGGVLPLARTVFTAHAIASAGTLAASLAQDPSKANLKYALFKKGWWGPMTQAAVGTLSYALALSSESEGLYYGSYVMLSTVGTIAGLAPLAQQLAPTVGGPLKEQAKKLLGPSVSSVKAGVVSRYTGAKDAASAGASWFLSYARSILNAASNNKKYLVAAAVALYAFAEYAGYGLGISSLLSEYDITSDDLEVAGFDPAANTTGFVGAQLPMLCDVAQDSAAAIARSASGVVEAVIPDAVSNCVVAAYCGMCDTLQLGGGLEANATGLADLSAAAASGEAPLIDLTAQAAQDPGYLQCCWSMLVCAGAAVGTAAYEAKAVGDLVFGDGKGFSVDPFSMSP